jgi:hypothetical protein
VFDYKYLLNLEIACLLQVEEADPHTLEMPAMLRPVPPLALPPRQHSLDVVEPPEYFAQLKYRPMNIKLIPIEVPIRSTFVCLYCSFTHRIFMSDIFRDLRVVI